MTRKEARKAAEVMLAYAEGKDIEYCPKCDSIWELATTPNFNWIGVNYRIKKKPTYRPFKNKEECWNEMLKHQLFGWLKYTGAYINIAYIDDKGISYLPDSDFENLDYTASLKYMKFADDVSFGIKEE